MTELRNRGVKDVLFVCTDGLTGFPEAIDAVFPQAVNQTCIVHLVRQSLRYLSWRERKACAACFRRVHPRVRLRDDDGGEFVLDHVPRIARRAGHGSRRRQVGNLGKRRAVSAMWVNVAATGASGRLRATPDALPPSPANPRDRPGPARELAGFVWAITTNQPLRSL